MLVWLLRSDMLWRVSYYHIIVIAAEIHTRHRNETIQEQYTRTQPYIKQFMSLAGFNLAH